MVDDSNEVYSFTKKDMEKMWNKRMKDEINKEIEGKNLSENPSSGTRMKKMRLGDKHSGSARQKKKTGLIPIK